VTLLTLVSELSLSSPFQVGFIPSVLRMVKQNCVEMMIGLNAFEMRRPPLESAEVL